MDWPSILPCNQCGGEAAVKHVQLEYRRHDRMSGSAYELRRVKVTVECPTCGIRTQAGTSWPPILPDST